MRSQSWSLKVSGGLQTTYYFSPVKMRHYHLSTICPTRLSLPGQRWPLPQSRKPQSGTKHLLSNPNEHGILYLAPHIHICSQSEEGPQFTQEPPGDSSSGQSEKETPWTWPLSLFLCACYQLKDQDGSFTPTSFHHCPGCLENIPPVNDTTSNTSSLLLALPDPLTPHQIVLNWGKGKPCFFYHK